MERSQPEGRSTENEGAKIKKWRKLARGFREKRRKTVVKQGLGVLQVSSVNVIPQMPHLFTPSSPPETMQSK